MVILGELLKIQSHRSNYEAMSNYIIKCLEGSKEVHYTQDEIGNIYVTKGELEIDYPAFACRTNSEQDIVENYQVLRLGKSHTWMALTETNGKAATKGIGGDAKCGIYLCLKLIQSLPAVKCMFFVESGKGYKGAMECDLNFFRDCRWLIEFDRKGRGDIVTEANVKDICSKDFKEKLEKLGKKYNFQSVKGGKCDASILKVERKLNISAVNISAGFYRPNSQDERIIEKDLMQVLQLSKDIAEEIKETSTHQCTAYYSQASPPPITTENTALSRVRTIIPIARRLPGARECKKCSQTLAPEDVILCNTCMGKVNLGAPISIKAVFCTICDVRLYKGEEIAKKQCGRHGAGRLSMYNPDAY
jgi:hypothetical protein